MNFSKNYDSFHRTLVSFQAGQVINEISNAIDKSNESNKELLIYRSIAKLEIGLLNRAEADCELYMRSEKRSIMGYFIKGLIELWSLKEEEAIGTWEEGLRICSAFSFYSFVYCLVNDSNLRVKVFNMKFKVSEVLNFAEVFDIKTKFNDSDINAGFLELRNESLDKAICTFNMILKGNKENLQAYKGRGIAYCLLGDWKKAIDDLSFAINKGFEIEDLRKFRAIAYSAVGYYSSAISDYSIVIQKEPLNYELREERAKLLMARKMYSKGLNDLNYIPKKCRTSNTYKYLAECEYALGNLEKAEKFINLAKNENDSDSYYCGYMIFRDLNKHELAKENLMKAVSIKKDSFFLLKTCGDYFYETGELFEAKDYYKKALEINDKDIETQKLYAFTLFQTGEENEALKLFMKLNDELGFDLNEDNYVFQNFEKQQFTQIMYKQYSNDLKYLLNLMENANNTFWSLNVNYFKKSFTFPKDFHFKTKELNDIEIQMIIDAERLGSKCIQEGPEAVYNKRLARCFGFCILYVSQRLRANVKFDFNWANALKQIKDILSLADAKNNINLIYNKDINGSIYVQTYYISNYYLQKGERISPKYGYKIPYAIERIKNTFMLKDNVLPKIDSLNSLYCYTQSNIFDNGKWCLQKDSSINEKFKFQNAIELSKPSLVLEFLGPFGYNFFIKPPSDKTDFEDYFNIFEKSWRLFVSNHFPDSKYMLSLFILLIWIIQPLSDYSYEIGLIILHSYYLYRKKLELNKFMNGNDLFISQLINPDIDNMNNTINDFVKNNNQASSVKETSLSYWDNELPISHVLDLINYKLNDN